MMSAVSSTRSQRMSAPVASIARMAATATSGPIPSPGIRVTWCGMLKIMAEVHQRKPGQTAFSGTVPLCRLCRSMVPERVSVPVFAGAELDFLTFLVRLDFDVDVAGVVAQQAFGAGEGCLSIRRKRLTAQLHETGFGKLQSKWNVDKPIAESVEPGPLT